MQETVLITGATGLVGTRLTELLMEKGYRVKTISRSCKKGNPATCFTWDLDAQTWDDKAIGEVRHIINLAGANVAEGRWTAKRKAEILQSRIRSSQLVSNMVEASNRSIKSVISASAVGYYGIDTGLEEVIETSQNGNDFLAQVCADWEKAISESDTNVAIIRTGVVLSTNGGALTKMLTPIKYGLGAALGSGTQLMPWIHIDDLCKMYIYLMENSINGIYNGVAPQAISNVGFTKQLAKQVNRKIFLPNIPSFLLHLMLGEMSSMLLTGVNASSSKIEEIGYKFEFPSFSKALNNLFP